VQSKMFIALFVSTSGEELLASDQSPVQSSVCDTFIYVSVHVVIIQREIYETNASTAVPVSPQASLNPLPARFDYTLRIIC
jgi:hypothetical protein